MEADWFAIMCRSGAEFKASDSLRNAGFGIWCPHELVRRIQRLRNSAKTVWQNEPYFPTYFFASLQTPSHSFSQINSTDGVIRVVGTAGEPLRIPGEVMAALFEMGDEDGLIGEVDATAPKAREKFNPGDRVRFTPDSVFADFIAEIQNDAGPNVRLWVENMGKKTLMSVPPNMITAAA